VLLDEVDKELEKRGHAFVRYADDCNVYVRSHRAGQRVMELLRRLFGRLRLRVNESKSAVDLAKRRKILGYSFCEAPDQKVKLRVAGKALATLKARIRRITRRTGGRSMTRVIEELREYLPGWSNYFSLSETPTPLVYLDKWIRHRLRSLYLKQWKRGPTAYRRLRAYGASHRAAATVAANMRFRWKTARHALNAALPNSHFEALGLPRLGA
jgi:RNA-directed DNA polymerase